MKRLILTICLCMLLFSGTASAVLTSVMYVDGPQDPLAVPYDVDELGIAPAFPPDELISTYDYSTDLTVCLDPLTPDLPLPNVMVGMTNLTLTTWTEVWYVAEPEETFHSNFDGSVGAMAGGALGTAFRIDNAILDPGGIHWPLIAEIGGIVDGLWQPGETWEFVLQDYSNALGKPASLLGSIGVPSPPPVPDLSSGSIIAIPEPATVCLLGLGSLALLRKKRRA